VTKILSSRPNGLQWTAALRLSRILGALAPPQASACVRLVLIAGVLFCACDPGGLRRVQLQLRAPATSGTNIAVGSPDVQEALQTLDAVAVRHGFYLGESESGDIRAYSLHRPPVTVDGRVYTRSIHCRVRLTSTGLLVTFGEFGFLASNPEAEGLFVDVRDAFIKRYGKKNVRSHRFGNT